MKLEFTKVHGAGNDFIVFKYPDLADEKFAEVAPYLCDRRKGVGADGLLIVREDSEYDFRMVYLNSDGSRASFCGNGARSLVLYAWVEGIATHQMIFRSDVGIHKGLISKGNPSVSLPDPKNIQLDISLSEFDFPLYFVDSGVPHAVVFVENLASFDVANVGRLIRNHPRFSPEGTNADFIEIHDDGSSSVRTYERGVEAETLACGTGAAAAAAILHRLRNIPPPIELHFPGGLLKVGFESNDSSIFNVMLGGETALIFKGEIEL